MHLCNAVVTLRTVNLRLKHMQLQGFLTCLIFAVTLGVQRGHSNAETNRDQRKHGYKSAVVASPKVSEERALTTCA